MFIEKLNENFGHVSGWTSSDKFSIIVILAAFLLLESEKYSRITIQRILIMFQPLKKNVIFQQTDFGYDFKLNHWSLMFHMIRNHVSVSCKRNGET